MKYQKEVIIDGLGQLKTGDIVSVESHGHENRFTCETRFGVIVGSYATLDNLNCTVAESWLIEMIAHGAKVIRRVQPDPSTPIRDLSVEQLQQCLGEGFHVAEYSGRISVKHLGLGRDIYWSHVDVSSHPGLKTFGDLVDLIRFKTGYDLAAKDDKE